MHDNETPQTQVSNPVHATVCHRVMTADIDWYPRAEYKGQTIYFCTEFCLEAFRAAPERFYIAHSRRKDIRK